MREYRTPKGSVTKFGYRRIKQKDRRSRFEHVLVWERHHGPVPPGRCSRGWRRSTVRS